MQQFWNERYTSNTTVYGNKANDYFKLKLGQLKPSSILLPAEGEGRNAIYAALNGWQVKAFDYSEAAMFKALNAARDSKLEIDYSVVDINQYQVKELYDAIGLIYVHLPSVERTVFHQKMIDSLLPGGTIIMEAFSKEQIHNTSGGPKAIDQLYSLEDIRTDFKNLDIIELNAMEVQLDEGPFHQGKASVIRLLAMKSL